MQHFGRNLKITVILIQENQKICQKRCTYCSISFGLVGTFIEFYKAFNFLFLLELLKFSKELFSFHKYVHLLIFLLLLKSTFIPRWSDKTQGVIWFSCICWGLFCDWEYGQFWKRYHELLKRRYILLCLAEMFYRCLLGPFWIIII